MCSRTCGSSCSILPNTTAYQSTSLLFYRSHQLFYSKRFGAHPGEFIVAIWVSILHSVLIPSHALPYRSNLISDKVFSAVSVHKIEKRLFLSLPKGLQTHFLCASHATDAAHTRILRLRILLVSFLWIWCFELVYFSMATTTMTWHFCDAWIR